MHSQSEQLPLKFLILRRIGPNYVQVEENKVAIALQSYITFMYRKFFLYNNLCIKVGKSPLQEIVKDFKHKF